MILSFFNRDFYKNPALSNRDFLFNEDAQTFSELQLSDIPIFLLFTERKALIQFTLRLHSFMITSRNKKIFQSRNLILRTSRVCTNEMQFGV